MVDIEISGIFAFCVFIAGDSGTQVPLTFSENGYADGIPDAPPLWGVVLYESHKKVQCFYCNASAFRLVFELLQKVIDISKGSVSYLSAHILPVSFLPSATENPWHTADYFSSIRTNLAKK